MKFSSELETNSNYEQARKGLLVVSFTLKRGLVSNQKDTGPFSFEI